MSFFLPFQCVGKDYEPELVSSKPPTVNVVDLTTPIPTTTIDLTTREPLISSNDQEQGETPHSWTKDEEALFEFESAAFDTALRIDQPKEDKAFIAVYGTGPSFITKFFFQGHTDALELADAHASVVTLGLRIGRVLRSRVKAYYTQVKKRPLGTGPQDFPDQVEESKNIMWELSALF